jgi:hypothetical protein
MTARQEVSKFLCNRAIQLREEGRLREAIEAIDGAERFDPINPACDELGYDLALSLGSARLGARVTLSHIGIPADEVIVSPTPTDTRSPTTPLTASICSWALPSVPVAARTPETPRPVHRPNSISAASNGHHPLQPTRPTPFDHLHKQPQPGRHGPLPPRPPMAPNPFTLPKLSPVRHVPPLVRPMPGVPGTISEPTQHNKEHPT